MKRKMFILGLDGASYDLIKKFIGEGELPNFKKMVENQKFAKLNSTIPPHTAPGWASAFTGVGPGQHGIFQFWDTQSTNYEGHLMGSNDFRRLPVWNILNKYGIKTGVVNVPMTHPLKKVDGYMISWPLSNTLRYCDPPEMLIGIAKSKGHYASDYSTMYGGQLDYIQRALEITRKRVKTCEHLINNTEWDLIINVFTEIDRISHFYWHNMDETSLEYDKDAEQKYKEAIHDIYVETDRALGMIINMLPKETFVLVLSDHGFGRGDLNYYIQTFLLENSLLEIMEVESNTVDSNQKDVMESSVMNWFECFHNGKKYGVDWSKTKAYMAAPSSYGININLKGRQSQGIVDEAEYEAYRELLVEKISNIQHPETGAKLFLKVLRREEVYHGDEIKSAPDLIIIPENYGIMLHHALNPDVFVGSPEQKGMHRTEGIIGLYGYNYETTSIFENARLEDITPTILDYFGITIPDYIEGKSLCEFKKSHKTTVYEENKQLENDLNINYSQHEVVEAKKRLSSLGYL